MRDNNNFDMLLSDGLAPYIETGVGVLKYDTETALTNKTRKGDALYK